MNLEEEVFKYRAKNNLSRRAMGLLCGVSLSTIQNIEDGMNISPEFKDRILKVIK